MQLTTKQTTFPQHPSQQMIKKISGRKKRDEAVRFYLFISLWLIGFILFSGGPILASAVLSFTDWSLLSSPHWIGLQNYQQILQDPLFPIVLKNTFYYGVGSVIFGVVISFLLALLLNQKVRGMTFFRTVFYLPSVVSGIATALLFINIFNPDFGLINYLLGLLGIQGPGWLTSTDWVIPALIIMSVWGTGGTMIIYLAGLQSIPGHLYEAVALDGGGVWAKFQNVTLPMISPVIFFNLVTSFIASLQGFVLILIMTNGGPANASLVYGLYIYRQAFQYFNMGYASALAWVLFIIIMIVTLIQVALAGRFVYYEGDIRGR